MQHRNRQQPTLFHIVDAKVADVRPETPPKEGASLLVEGVRQSFILYRLHTVR